MFSIQASDIIKATVMIMAHEGVGRHTQLRPSRGSSAKDVMPFVR